MSSRFKSLIRDQGPRKTMRLMVGVDASLCVPGISRRGKVLIHAAADAGKRFLMRAGRILERKLNPNVSKEKSERKVGQKNLSVEDVLDVGHVMGIASKWLLSGRLSRRQKHRQDDNLATSQMVGSALG